MMSKIFILIVSAAMIVSCAATQTNSDSRHFDFKKFGFSKQVDLDRVVLNEKELPEGYQFTPVMLSQPGAYRVVKFYQNTLDYWPTFGKVDDKFYQSIAGPDGDCGTIMYFSFDRQLNGDAYRVLAKEFWRTRVPSKYDSPEFFIGNNVVIIWCLPMESPMKKNAQEKLFALLNQN